MVTFMVVFLFYNLRSDAAEVFMGRQLPRPNTLKSSKTRTPLNYNVCHGTLKVLNTTTQLGQDRRARVYRVGMRRSTQGTQDPLIH